MATIDTYNGVKLDVTVDLACEAATPVIRCKQGDSKRLIQISPRENGEKLITVAEDETVMLDPTGEYGDAVGECIVRVQRADGALYTINLADVSCQWVDRAVPNTSHTKALEYLGVWLTEDMLAVDGRALCDVQFKGYELDSYIATASFFLDIEPKPTAKANGGVDPASFVNVKKISATDYATITPDASTLYIIIDGENVSLAFGSAVLSSGGGYNETQVSDITDSYWEVTP